MNGATLLTVSSAKQTQSHVLTAIAITSKQASDERNDAEQREIFATLTRELAEAHAKVVVALRALGIEPGVEV